LFLSYSFAYNLTFTIEEPSMRPTEFSNEDIIKAGKELVAAGRNVTGFALRQRVGGGSAPRLKQVWDEHISSQSSEPPTEQAELPVELDDQLKAVSAELVDRLQKLASDMHTKAVRASERRVAEIVRTAGEQRAQAERELADASMTVDELEAKLDAATNEIQELREKVAEATRTSQAQAVELAQLKERMATAENAHRLSDERCQAEHARANEAHDKASRLQGQIEALEKLLGKAAPRT